MWRNLCLIQSYDPSAKLRIFSIVHLSLRNLPPYKKGKKKMNICQTQWSKQTSLYSLFLTTITSTNETYTVILQPPNTRTFLNVNNTRDPSSTTNSRNMLKKVKSTACLINGQALPRTKYPNRSLDTLIFPIIPRSIWQFVAFPYI